MSIPKLHKPYCFVAMPFGMKPDPAEGPDIDFDHIYESVIRPGIEAAEMIPIRADAEKLGGIIHRPMFERLLLCDYVVADLTTGNANVFYELGVRHAVRPRTTLTIAADEKRLPFDVVFLRTLVYKLNQQNRLDESVAKAFASEICSRLKAAYAQQWRRPMPEGSAMGSDPSPLENYIDSPLFQLISEYRAPPLAHLKTGAFSEQIARMHHVQRALEDATVLGRSGASGRKKALEQLGTLLEGVGPVSELEAGAIVDLMLAYRAIGAWERIVDAYDALPPALQHQELPRTLVAMALNRHAENLMEDPEQRAEAAVLRSRALRHLHAIEADIGASPETAGLIGRIHKSSWIAAGGDVAAAGHLRNAIAAYRRGFLSDIRNFYPGVNLLTLLKAEGTSSADAEFARTLPVVRFAVERALADDPDDYWKHATLLELAVLAGDEASAREHLSAARAAICEDFQPQTTADNLRIVATARGPQGIPPYIDEILEGLLQKV